MIAMSVTKTLPTIVGYHCNGECWKNMGESAQLIRWLENKSPTLRDWFANGDWTTESKSISHKLPPINEIHPIQDYIVIETVENYLFDRRQTEIEPKEFYEIHPTLFKWQNKIFIFQGTHRLVAHYLNADADFTGWFLDLDPL